MEFGNASDQMPNSTSDINPPVTLDKEFTKLFGTDSEALPNYNEALPSPRKWRREVVKKGDRVAYWIWRRGTGPARQSLKGGKFGELDEQRKAEYDRNVERRAKGKANREAKKQIASK